MTSAILSYCLNLTDPNATSIDLFRVSIVDSKPKIQYLPAFDDLGHLCSSDITLEMIVFFPQTLAPLLSSVGEENFFSSLVAGTRYSSLYVSRLEPC